MEPSRLREGGGHPRSPGFMGEPSLEPRTQMSHLEFTVRGLFAPLTLVAMALLCGDGEQGTVWAWDFEGVVSV